MKSDGSLYIGGMRLFWGWIASQIDNLFVKSYLSSVWLLLKPMFEADTFEASFVGVFAVRPILPVGRGAQVVPSIIGFLPIFVIDLFQRPLTRHVEPCETVSGVGFSENLNVNISLSVKPSGDLSWSYFGAPGTPPKYPRIRIVMDKFAELAVRDFFHAPKIANLACTGKD